MNRWYLDNPILAYLMHATVLPTFFKPIKTGEFFSSMK